MGSTILITAVWGDAARRAGSSRAARQAMEADPTTFFRHDLPVLLREAAARLAGFLGGRAEDWAFVENATAGLNAIIASLRLQPATN